jgi:hypothetical protein
MPEGAQVATNTGQFCYATPCNLRMERNRHFELTVMKQGYRTTKARVRPKVSGTGLAVSVLGNAMIGGALGFTVDWIYGAPFDLKPDHLDVQMERLVTLGVSLSDPATLSADDEDVQGVTVSNVVAGSVAERAGFRTGDRLTMLNGRTVGDPRGLVDALTSIQPDTLVQASVVRAGRTANIDLQF